MTARTLTWFVGQEAFECERLPKLCSGCGVYGAITALPPPELAKQRDGTTHVCHPGLGGCNHGFADERPICSSCGFPIDGEVQHGCCGEEALALCGDCKATYRCHTDVDDPREMKGYAE